MIIRSRLFALAFGVLLFVTLAVIAGAGASAPAVAGLSASWRSLPRAPILGRLDASAVWTGRAMLVWGGVTRGGAFVDNAPRSDSDGAAYTPSTRKWHKIARSPSGVLGGGGSAVAWTGQQMVVWAGNSPDGPADGAVYDPRSNTWRRLPNGPLGVREGYVSVLTGKELVIFGGHTAGIATPTAAAVNPRTGSWRRLPALNAVTGLAVANGAVWDGHQAFVSGDLYHNARFVRPILFAFNPTTDKVREIDLAAAPIAAKQRSQLDPVGWSGTEVVFWTGAVSSLSLVVRYNPATGRWTKAKAAPCRSSALIAWIGHSLVAACASNGLQIYSARTDSWRAITTGPSPLREGSAIAWTGTDLIVWSGVGNQRYNPTPAEGASITLTGL